MAFIELSVSAEGMGMRMLDSLWIAGLHPGGAPPADSTIRQISCLTTYWKALLG